VIAVAGIGSMLALWVRQRIREIGIRIALGAAPADILSTVLRQGMLLAHYCWPAGFPRAVPRGSIRKSRCAANKIHISPSELKS
jgi:hypothetical protein